VISIASPAFGRGLIRDHWLKPPNTHHQLLGAQLRAPVAPIAGSWDMLVNVGGVGNQGNTSQCKGFAGRKGFGLYALGQTGIPRTFSANWIYTCARAKARAMELGGVPTLAQIQANPLTDDGSEPSCAVLGAQQVGIAQEADWPTITDGSNPALNKELDLGGVVTAQLWKPQTLGYASIQADNDTDQIQAFNVALSPFTDGKRGRGIELSIASGTQAVEGADGSRVLTASDFNGKQYDHAGIVIGYRFNTTTITYDYLWSNSWDVTWAPLCTVPELGMNGVPTGGTVPMPGCCWISQDAILAMADWTIIGEVLSHA
jgi:hypothetical protein